MYGPAAPALPHVHGPYVVAGLRGNGARDARRGLRLRPLRSVTKPCGASGAPLRGGFPDVVREKAKSALGDVML